MISRIPSREELERMYITEKSTMAQIAVERGVTNCTVRNWLKKYNIFIRDTRESRWGEKTQCPQREELEDLYVQQQLSTVEIAKRMNVGSDTVGKWLDKKGIVVRDRTACRTMSGTSKIPQEKLKRLYVDERKSSKEIAQTFGVAGSTVCSWLREYGIPIRTNKEAHSSEKIPPKDEIETFYKEGENATEIGDRYGVSNNTVIRWMKFYGIMRRNKAGIYDNREYREDVLRKVVEKTGKSLDKLVASDFAKVVGDDGTSYNGLIAWYKRKHNCSYVQSVGFLLSDLLDLSIERNESLLEQYAGGEK